MLIRVNSKSYDVVIDKWVDGSGRCNLDMMPDLIGTGYDSDEDGTVLMTEKDFKEFTEYFREEIDRINTEKEGLCEDEELMLVVENGESIYEEDKKMKYQVRDYEAGNVIREFETESEAIECLKAFEKADEIEAMRDGEEYEPGFYEVYDSEAGEMVYREI